MSPSTCSTTERVGGVALASDNRVLAASEVIGAVLANPDWPASASAAHLGVEVLIVKEAGRPLVQAWHDRSACGRTCGHVVRRQRRANPVGADQSERVARPLVTTEVGTSRYNGGYTRHY